MVKAPLLPISLRISEASHLMAIGRNTLKRLCDQGEILGQRMHGDYGERRVYRASVVRWLRRHNSEFIHPKLICDVFAVGCRHAWSEQLNDLLSPDDFRVSIFDSCTPLIRHRSPRMLIADATGISEDQWSRLKDSWPDLSYCAVLLSEDGDGRDWNACANFPNGTRPAIVAGKIKRLI